ncbi:MAG: OmpA family protein [Bdellovibrionales bacterium]
MSHHRLATVVIMCSSVSLALGCANMSKGQKGAAAGAAVGGTVGGLSKGTTGAVLGAAGGAIAGGLMGEYLERRQKELQQVVPTEKTEDGLKIKMQSDVLFGFDNAELRPDAKKTLAELAGVLEKYPKDKLRIAGYTDHLGAEAYNQKLSEQRAENVKVYLAAQGVESQMTAVGKGEILGKEKEKDPAALKEDRRVEIFVDVAPPENARK